MRLLAKSATDAHAYRPDIDGLRALAVCAVLVFHAFPDALPGGFAGVDLFFVISGYLITGILAQGHAAGSFSLARFYARRVRRIFPALALVLTGTYALGWFVLTADEYKQLGKHIWAGAGFLSNWVLWREAGYFDHAANTKPLLHLWSLAVEEQFYLFWPLVLGLAMRWRRAAAVCAMLLVLSFGANAWMIRADAAATFFLPQTRFWEMLAGALLALVPRARPTAGRQADLLSVAGLALCSVAFLLLRAEYAFPGWWALVPVLGACALIGAGPQGWVNRTILAHPCAVWIGSISYPLYLWHWPLLSYTFIVAGEQPVPAWVRLALLAASVVLAWLTTHLLEARFRFGPAHVAKVMVPCLAMLAIGFVGNRVYERDGFKFRKGHDAHADVATASVGEGRAFVRSDCGIADSRLVPYCATDRRAASRFAIWGDSKADALYWGLVRRSAPGQSWTMLGRSSCAPLAGVERTSIYAGDRPADCAAANRQILQALLANPAIDTVVLSFSVRATIGPSFAYSGAGPQGDHTALVLEGLDRAVTALEGAGKRVAVVLDNPTLPDPRRCMERAVMAWPGVRSALALRDGAAARCDLAYGQHLAQHQVFVAMVDRLQRRHASLLVYDPAQVLCDLARKVCPMTLAGKYLYSYGDHVSDTGNGRIADALLPLLVQQAVAQAEKTLPVARGEG
ncbi:acyltransferase family protein [Massilia sp. S19_KUP03_FR1]|uniref:acyltransferase family protein n=1 Tax=Massilia sp. S19_KUP03_FR1 TaxID=3025503 RepID=UPI002FCD9221